MTAKKILFVVNDAPFFLSHRLPLALAARAVGYEVHVATPRSARVEIILSHGLQHHVIPLSRQGMRVFTELRSMAALWWLYRRLQPDLVHHVTIKPVLYGGLAARLAGVPAMVSAVTGLGYVFANQSGQAVRLRRFVKEAYHLALGHPHSRVIFQNPDDQALFIGDGLVSPERASLICGSGVDLSVFASRDEPKGDPPVVMLASRMLWDKGVGEFVEAARCLRGEGVAARFVLVGDSDPGNPSAVPKEQLESWRDHRVVEWWGARDDMPATLAQAHLVCLPSYREGAPKVLLEAAACGRAIVTTDTPGCREIVKQGVNGLLVPVRDGVALAGAVRRLLDDPEERQRMGAAGRRRAEQEFAIEKVIESTLDLYRDLLTTPCPELTQCRPDETQ